MVTDISSRVRARRWLRYAAWPLYIGATCTGLLSLLFFAVSPGDIIIWLAPAAAALALLGYAIEKGSRVGAIVVVALVPGHNLSRPELAGWTWPLSVTAEDTG